MEKDDEVNGGIGLSYTTEFRQYDSRIGRWLSIDPKTSKFAMFSPYESFHNNPIVNTDPKGDCPECGMFAKFFRNVFGIDALPGNEFTYPGTERKRGTWFYDYGDGFRMNSTDRNGIVHRDNFMAIRQEWNVPLLHGTPIDPVSEIRVVSAREVSVNVLVNNVLPKFGTPGVGVSRPNESRSAELVVYGTITTTTADATTGEVLSTVTQDYFVVYALNHERGGYLTTGDIIRKGITARDTPIPYSAVIQGAIKDAVMNNSGAAKRGLDAIQQQMYEDGNGVQQIIEQDTRSDQEAEYTRPPR
jgi:RHS repeat-associated protein